MLRDEDIIDRDGQPTAFNEYVAIVRDPAEQLHRAVADPTERLGLGPLSGPLWIVFHASHTSLGSRF